jgi:hypothetical protein
MNFIPPVPLFLSIVSPHEIRHSQITLLAKYTVEVLPRKREIRAVLLLGMVRARHRITEQKRPHHPALEPERDRRALICIEASLFESGLGVDAHNGAVPVVQQVDFVDEVDQGGAPSGGGSAPVVGRREVVKGFVESPEAVYGDKASQGREVVLHCNGHGAEALAVADEEGAVALFCTLDLGFLANCVEWC